MGWPEAAMYCVLFIILGPVAALVAFCIVALFLYLLVFGIFLALVWLFERLGA